jgi:signal transduction histidine kinase
LVAGSGCLPHTGFPGFPVFHRKQSGSNVSYRLPGRAGVPHYIHRHAGSPTAGIRIIQDEACLRVEIEDAGKVIPLEKGSALGSSAPTGLGLRGMRERVRQLGGTLQVQSNSPGTRVTAVLPVLPVLRATAAPPGQEVSRVALT